MEYAKNQTVNLIVFLSGKLYTTKKLCSLKGQHWKYGLSFWSIKGWVGIHENQGTTDCHHRSKAHPHFLNRLCCPSYCKSTDFMWTMFKLLQDNLELNFVMLTHPTTFDKKSFTEQMEELAFWWEPRQSGETPVNEGQINPPWGKLWPMRDESPEGTRVNSRSTSSGLDYLGCSSSTLLLGKRPLN